MENPKVSLIDHLWHSQYGNIPETKHTEQDINNNDNNFKFPPLKNLDVNFKKLLPGKKSKHDLTWHKNFSIVCFPFILIGFPCHLLISTKPGEPKLTWKEWLKLLYSPLNNNALLGLITIPLLIYALVISYFVLNEVCLIFHSLLIKGEFNLHVFLQIIKVIRILPAYLPFIIIWIYGYPLRNLITSFDIFRDDFKKYSPCSNLLKLVPTSFGIKFTIVYIGIICTHLIPYFTIGWENKQNDKLTNLWEFKDKDKLLSWWESRKQQQLQNNCKFLIYWVDITYSLILPFYLMFLLGIQTQFKLMSRFMNILVKENKRPDLQTLLHIKYLYKRLTSEVIYINDVFGLYLSWVIPARAYTIGLQLFLTLLYSMGFAALSTLKKFFNPLDFTDTPELVRSTVANILVFTIYFILCGYIIWEAIWTNDEIRYTQVLLNDYLSDRDRDPPALLVETDEIYKSARHLKFILQSTSKQQNPTLIRISIVSFYPWLNNRLHTSDLYHVIVHGRFIKDIV